MEDTQSNLPSLIKEDQAKRNVLIVEDSSVIRKLLERELTKTYFIPLSAGDGESAIKIAETEKIDIMLIDVNLPDIDGIDLLQKLKIQQPDSVAIIMTSLGSEEIAVQALKKGAIDYLSKPFSTADLSAALGRALEKLEAKQGDEYKNTILITDDELPVVEQLKKFLDKEGFLTFGALSAEEGLEIITKQRIDILITDIRMGGMNGMDYFVKAKSLYPDIEGIVVTGNKNLEFSVQMLRAGAFDYINKPVDLGDLLFSVNKAIERIHLNRSRVFRERETKITSEIISKNNEELERRVEQRSKELMLIQTQLVQTSKLATLGEMATGLAHEMNQPLGGIALVATSFRKYMEKGLLNNERLTAGVKDIESCIERMSYIINHIRTFARQEALEFAQIDVTTTIDATLGLLGEQLRMREIEVIKYFEPDLPKVLGEPHQLEQVWINCITNARDAMDEKQKQITEGKLKIEGYQKKLVISVTHDKAANRVLLAFADNGMGIDEETKKKVFEPFFTTKEVGKGTGLGLSISFGIIESHKGHIEMDGKKDEGVTMKVYLLTGGGGR
ncbi:MAG: response regulator [Candidatus Omnitrophica bacterium]|nr:response regulator [Candidatus Omnitrophota bacterium]